MRGFVTDHEICKILPKRYKSTPENALFIDDNSTNIEAAKQPRFKTVLLDDIENASRRIPALIGKKT